MLKYNEFAPTMGVALNSNPDYLLQIIPSTPSATYSIPLDKLIEEGAVDVGIRKSNYLNFGICANITSTFNFNTNRNLFDVPITKNDTTYETSTITIMYGKYLEIYAWLSCSCTNIFPSSYDCSNVVLTNNGISYKGSLFEGTVSSSLVKNEYKLWRIKVSPKEVLTLDTKKPAISIVKSGFSSERLNNISVLSFDNKDTFYDSRFRTDNDTTIVNIPIVVIDNTYNFCWNSILPDFNTQTLTTGSSTASTSSYNIGAVALNKSNTINLQFLPTVKNASFFITKVVATVLTPTIKTLPVAIKDSVAKDYSIKVNTISSPLFSATSLVSTLATAIPLGVLDGVVITVKFTPKVKVITLANIVANSQRKISIKVYGYQTGLDPIEIQLGDAITISASIA